MKQTQFFLKLLAAIAGLAPLNSNAADASWTDGTADNLWVTGGNWTPAAAPGSTAFSFTQADTATFDLNRSDTVTIDSGRNIKFIAFKTNASTYTIGSNGGNSLLLANGGTISTAVASQFETIAAPLILEPASATTAGSYQFVPTGGAAATGATLNFTGPISGGTTSAGITLTLSGGSTNPTGSFISGDVSNGTANNLFLKKTNSSTFSLTGTNNSFNGGLEVDQGTLNVATISTTGNNSSIGAGGGIFCFTASGGTGTLKITGAGGTTDRAITIVRSGAGSGSGLIIDSSGSAPVTFSGGITSSAVATASTTSFNTLTLQGSNAGVNTVSGNITDFDVTAGNEKLMAVVKAGANTWTLSGNNNYTGSTAINAGTLNLGSATAIGSGPLTFGGSATFDNTSGAAFTKNVASITLTGGSPTFTGSSSLNLGTGNVGLGTSSGGTRTITVTANTLSIGGIVNGTNATPTTQFTKAGNGVLEINGNSTNTGLTTISAGTMLVNGNHTSAGAYSVSASGTLGGGGSIATTGANTVTVAANSKLSPGNATTPGTFSLDLGSNQLDITPAVTASNSQSMLFDISSPGSSDRILLSNASSVLNIGTGVLEFNDFVFTASGVTGGTYTLFDTSNSIVGSLGANLTGTVGGLSATLQLSGNGQDVLLAVVPEPSTWAMMLGGLGMLVSMQRLRRRRA